LNFDKDWKFLLGDAKNAYSGTLEKAELQFKVEGE